MKESVNTIIQNSAGKYLLQMRDGTEGICHPLQWNFFGGGMKNSKPLGEVARELKEELGIESNAEDFDLVGDIAVGDSKVYIVKYKKEVNWRDFELFEGAGVGYFTKQEMLKINITENTKSIIEKYLGR